VLKGFLLLSEKTVDYSNLVKMASAQAKKMFGWQSPHIFEMVQSRYGYLVVVSDKVAQDDGPGSKTATVVAVT